MSLIFTIGQNSPEVGEDAFQFLHIALGMASITSGQAEKSKP